MAGFVKPNNKLIVINNKDNKFVQKANQNKVSDEFIATCKDISRNLFKRK